jgi:hypothetical protein
VTESLRLFAYLWSRIKNMAQQIVDLQTAIVDLQTKADAAIAAAAALQAKLDSVTASNAVLQSQVAAASAASSPSDLAAIAQATADVGVVSLKLAAVKAP